MTKNRPTAVIQRLCTKNDTNGNPRRIVAIHTDPVPAHPTSYGFGHFRRTLYFDQGYCGNDYTERVLKALGIEPRTALDLGDVIITPGEYRETMRLNDAHSGPEALVRHLTTPAVV